MFIFPLPIESSPIPRVFSAATPLFSKARLRFSLSIFREQRIGLSRPDVIRLT